MLKRFVDVKGAVFSFVIWVGFFYCSASFASQLEIHAMYSGKIPEAKRISMASDPACHSKFPNGKLIKRILTNPQGGLKDVFVYVKMDEKDVFDFESPKEVLELDQKGCEYTPHILGARVNQTIRFINSDETLHNVHALSKINKGFNIGMPIKDMKSEKAFKEQEIMIKMKCEVHPWMSAYIGILNHPFFCVTDDAGKCNIQDLPVGEYEVEGWHESLGTLASNILIQAEDGNKSITFEYSQ